MMSQKAACFALFVLGSSFLGSNCASLDGSSAEQSNTDKQREELTDRAMREDPVQPDAPDGMKIGTFAGGCFWCVEAGFEKVDGVEEAISGYSGGTLEDPSYDEVSHGKTAHTETVRVIYDPDTITYKKLLDKYWRLIDPTDDDGQFVDRGSQYRPVIFYHNERQKRLAEHSKEQLAQTGPFEEPIVVPIKPAGPFWKAEDYHQDFYKKSPDRYKSYRNGSGRNEFFEKHWKGE